MTRRSLAAIVWLFSATTLLAQTLPPFPQPPQPSGQKRFRFVAPTMKKGSEIQWKIPQDGHLEMVREEYAIMYPNVEITYQDVKVHADKITANLKTKDVVAEGHVIVDEGPTRLTADHIVYNLDSKTGTFFTATGALQPDMYFTGERIEKTGETTYRLTNGIITSCDLDRPAWSFHVVRADVTLDDYAYMHGVSFRARELPLIWLPRLIWPTKADRARGFLIPRLLLTNPSSKAGFGERLILGYFMPIGDSVDVTAYADLSTKNYEGIGIDLRYLPSPNVKLGELNAWVIHNPDPDPDVAHEPAKTEWRYQYQHAQDNLPGGFRGVIDVQDYSDLDFFRRYDRDPRLNSLSNVYSAAYLTKNDPRYSLNILTDRRDIFLGHETSSASSPIIKQRFEELPALQFRMYPQRVLSSPIYFSMESSASHLKTTGLLTGPNADYDRFDIFPTLSLQLRTPPWLSIKPQVSVRETRYSSQLDDASAAGVEFPEKTLDQSLNRSYAQGQVDVVGPSFSRIFNRQIGDFIRFKHVIEPRFRYVYTTDVFDAQNHVIRFDTVDTPLLPVVQNSVQYSLTQRLIAREKDPKSSPREILTFSLTQTVSLSKPFTSASGGTLTSTTQQNGKFTPLVAQLHVNPYQSITADAQATFGNVSHQIDQASFSANLVGTGKWADRYLGFTWFASFQTPTATIPTDPNTINLQTPAASQLRLNAGSPLWRSHLRADVAVNYDAETGQLLEQDYRLGGQGSCWGLSLEYRRYFTFDRGYIPTVGIAVTLKNVGTFGTH
ncbi:MAG TPA: LPS assembly protein LptD [Thermoanaerobaculia bacterium]